jgi:hypothetical protein
MVLLIVLLNDGETELLGIAVLVVDGCIDVLTLRLGITDGLDVVDGCGDGIIELDNGRLLTELLNDVLTELLGTVD